ncbi:MAG TPA: type IX secretion system protein PorQ [Cytophagaceae bacterium]
MAALICLSFGAIAQIGGKNSYEFLDIPQSARTAGVGGVNVSIVANDPFLFFQNPALLRDTSVKNLGITYVPYYADINHTSLAYAFKAKRTGIWGAGLQYISYGAMEEADEAGNVTGTFMAKDYAVSVAKSHTIDYYTMGATLKFAGSHIQNYNSFALMADVGGVFTHPEKDFNIGLVVKNIGFALKKYTPDSRVAEPFDVQLGLTYKFDHMPLRFSVTAHHLHQFDIVYLDPNKRGKISLDGQEEKEKKTFADKVARHFVFGGEFLIAKGFNVRVGYNHLRRKELRLEQRSGGAGFSWGFMMKIKSFEFAFTRAYYHVAGGTSFITLNTNFSNLLKRKEI